MGFRHALRRLARTPGFVAIAVATLAVGIGLNTSVFTIYDSVALRGLPVPAPNAILRLRWASDGYPSDQFSWRDYERLAAGTRSFAAVIATSAPQTIACHVSGFPGTEMARVRAVSDNYFTALNIQPEIGRAFGPADRGVAVISHDFWANRMAKDPDVYGRDLAIGGATLTIIGVAPLQFAGTGAPPETPDVWIQASAQPAVMSGADWIHDDTVRLWQILARRENGVTAQQYSAELAVLSAQWPPADGKPVRLTAARASFFETDDGGVATFVQVCEVLMVGVALVLLIACVNLTNLIAARNAGRSRELALRLALGASRARLVRQLCGESLMLGAIGGAAGFVLSLWTCRWAAIKGMELVREISNGALAVSLDVTPAWRVFAWTAAVSAITGIAVGVVPALRASGADIAAPLKELTAGAFGSVGRRQHRSFLLAAQVASCLVLLAAAGLIFRGVYRSMHVDAGFDAKRLLVVGIDTRGMAGSASARVELQRKAITALRALPDIGAVAWADRAPLLGTGSGTFRNQQGGKLDCMFNGISDEYFAATGIPVVEGRAFTPSEIEERTPVAVISQSAARRLWPGQNVLGRRIAPATVDFGERLGYQSLTVIGVAKTVRSTWISKEDQAYVYVPRRLNDASATLLLHTEVRPEKLFNNVSSALARVDANLPARAFMVSLEQGPLRIQELMAQAPAVAAALLGGIALMLSCLGIYGVISRVVSQRTREIGIRIALGSPGWSIVKLVGAQTLQPVGWGALAGFGGAFGAAALLHAMIIIPQAPDLTYGAGSFDPITFLGVACVLLAVVLLAVAGPVRRAMGVEPAAALRDE